MKDLQEGEEAVLPEMLPPHYGSIRELSREEGISERTLYQWRAEARRQGVLLPAAEQGRSKVRKAGARGTSLPRC